MVLFAATVLASMGAVAEVRSSDGQHYYVGTCYVAPDRLTTEFTYPDRTLRFGINGARGTVKSGEREIAATEAHKRFAFGHQFHAIYLNFRTLVDGLQTTDRVRIGGTDHPALRGRLPHGGVGFLVQGRDRDLGMRFELPENAPILVEFDDWRMTDAGELPARLVISHEDRTFEYRFRTLAADCSAA